MKSRLKKQDSKKNDSYDFENVISNYFSSIGRLEDQLRLKREEERMSEYVGDAYDQER